MFSSIIKRRSRDQNIGQHCVLLHTEIKALDERMFVSYTIVVVMLFVKRSFAAYRRNSASYDTFYTSPYPDEVIDRLARAFYPAILACWNSEEGQREFAVWQAEQAHHTTSKEKQSVPDGERPAVHIAVVCGFWQGASVWVHPVFLYKKIC